MFDKKEFEIMCIRKDVKYCILAKELGVSLTTLTRKINRNGDFNRVEIIS